MDAPIRYFGGKGNMYKMIIEQFPDPTTYDTYIEPFAGSFTVALHNPHIPKIELYNDLNDDVYNLYTVLADPVTFERFKRLCDLAPYSETLRVTCMTKLKDGVVDNVERAFCYFYVNRSSHNSVGGFSINTVVRRNMSKSVSDFLSTVAGLKAFHDRISRVVFTNRDGIDMIAARKTDPDTFMYCDPPYVQNTRTSTTRYIVDMCNDEQVRFVDACIGAKSKVLISGYDSHIYDRLLDYGFTKSGFNVGYTSGDYKADVRTETLWKNY